MISGNKHWPAQAILSGTTVSFSSVLAQPKGRKYTCGSRKGTTACKEAQRRREATQDEKEAQRRKEAPQDGKETQRRKEAPHD